jgi:hypothetical protein
VSAGLERVPPFAVKFLLYLISVLKKIFRFSLSLVFLIGKRHFADSFPFSSPWPNLLLSSKCVVGLISLRVIPGRSSQKDRNVKPIVLQITFNQYFSKFS